MTSFTRKLFNRDPGAAMAFYKNQQFETRVVYGRHATLAQFTPAHHQIERTFGKRVTPPHDRKACAERCGHPACSQACVGLPLDVQKRFDLD